MQAGKKMYQLQLFSSVEHGFALRGDMKDPYQHERKLRGSSVRLLAIPEMNYYDSIVYGGEITVTRLLSNDYQFEGILPANV
ncbi:hypothetical protein H2198_008313 [Neophaeococcomyces mojaviensis]|uniref:Uncharacterized protein n=1 Tax=Neophaeococcomyces mojaviensis TaxID=3383035 RepID=A0ACC2ZXP5_9EURO|nr:hypothetical protein H2198_008313 [Knufia sp. JES_112]